MKEKIQKAFKQITKPQRQSQRKEKKKKKKKIGPLWMLFASIAGRGDLYTQKSKVHQEFRNPQASAEF